MAAPPFVNRPPPRPGGPVKRLRTTRVLTRRPLHGVLAKTDTTRLRLKLSRQQFARPRRWPPRDRHHFGPGVACHPVLGGGRARTATRRPADAFTRSRCALARGVSGSHRVEEEAQIGAEAAAPDGRAGRDRIPRAGRLWTHGRSLRVLRTAPTFRRPRPLAMAASRFLPDRVGVDRRWMGAALGGSPEAS